MEPSATGTGSGLRAGVELSAVAGVLPAERPGLCPDEAEPAKAIEVDRADPQLDPGVGL